MARKFSHPNVAALAVGESTAIVGVSLEVLKRRLDGFAKRHKRAYSFQFLADGSEATVTRLPDPPKGSHGYPPCDVNPQP